MIEVRNLSRSFTRYQHASGWKGVVKNLFSPQRETIHAVDDISFAIDDGEFVGYIGPNGAGKSTTIKMLAGILTPTSGEVIVNGLHPADQRKKHAMNIGAIFGQRSQLWWDLTIEDTYLLLKHMYRIDDLTYQGKVGSLKSLLDMGAFWNTPVRQLSLGQRMRGELGCALLHSPKILFLDEPTIGMDVVVKQDIKAFLREINRQQHTTLLLTTHDLHDIEDLCSRIILINHGKIVFDGSVDQMRTVVGALTLMTMTFDRSIENQNFTQVHEEIRECSDCRLTVAFNRSEAAPVDLLTSYSQYGNIVDIALAEPSIEDIVQRFYR